jgi:GTP cyclohydrolase I
MSDTKQQRVVSDQEDAVRGLLAAIGEDPDREGLLETPARYVKALGEWTSGYGQEPSDVLKVFSDGGENYDQMVLVKDIPVYSLCEHHMAPFWGVAHVAYIPDGKIVGLSKLTRLVNIFARRLQVQERLTQQVAQSLEDHLKPRGVGVILRCRHMCMESRGVRTAGSETVTSSLFGEIFERTKARAEFMSLAGNSTRA